MSHLPWRWCCHGPSRSHSTGGCAGCGWCSYSWCRWCSSSPTMQADQRRSNTREDEEQCCEHTHVGPQFSGSVAVTQSLPQKTWSDTLSDTSANSSSVLKEQKETLDSPNFTGSCCLTSIRIGKVDYQVTNVFCKMLFKSSLLCRISQRNHMLSAVVCTDKL